MFLYSHQKVQSLNSKFQFQQQIIYDIIQDVAGDYSIATNNGIYICRQTENRFQTILLTNLNGLAFQRSLYAYCLFGTDFCVYFRRNNFPASEKFLTYSSTRPIINLQSLQK